MVFRRATLLRSLVIAAGQAFVGFTIYGFALSLIAAASTVIRRRDTIILILAATIIWGIFVVEGRPSGMIHFLLFAALVTAGVLAARGLATGFGSAARIGLGALLPAVLCGAGGLVYYGLAGPSSAEVLDLKAGLSMGFSWGLALGVAVGLGLSVGAEVLEWMLSKDKS